MKKLLCILTISLVALSATACESPTKLLPFGTNSEANNYDDNTAERIAQTRNFHSDNAAADRQDNAVTYQETTASDESNAYSLTINNAYSMYAGGKNYILVEANFTNNTNENKSFYDAYEMIAFQNGVQLSQNNSWTCTKFDLKACAAKLQPGYSTNIYMGFEAKDLTSSVSVECSSLFGGKDVKTLLSVNSENYEVPTQATTAAPVYTPTPQAPAQTPQSSSGRYTCAGRSMTAARNLMTSSEVSIISNSSDQTLINEQYAKHGYCFNTPEWHIYFYGYDH
jgi:hypothetical protein